MIKIEIGPIPKSTNYRVWHDGEVLIPFTRLPFYAGARALARKGLSGPFQMWRRDGKFPDMANTIELACRWTVIENEKTGPVRAKFQEYNAAVHA